jgi:hypothetical protein
MLTLLMEVRLRSISRSQDTCPQVGGQKEDQQQEGPNGRQLFIHRQPTASFLDAQASCMTHLDPHHKPLLQGSPAARQWWQSWQHPAVACPRWGTTQGKSLPEPVGGPGKGRVLCGVGSGSPSGDRAGGLGDAVKGRTPCSYTLRHRVS